MEIGRRIHLCGINKFPTSPPNGDLGSDGSLCIAMFSAEIAVAASDTHTAQSPTK